MEKIRDPVRSGPVNRIFCLDPVRSGPVSKNPIRSGTKRDHILQEQLAAHYCVLVSRNFLQNVLVKLAAGFSGILVPQSIYIHINISVWDFIYII